MAKRKRRNSVLQRMKAGKHEYWAKRIRGRVQTFGNCEKVSQADAEARYLFEKPFLETGLPVPADDGSGVTVGELFDEYRKAKRKRIKQGRLSQRQFDDIEWVMEQIAEILSMETPLSCLTAQSFDEIRDKLVVKNDGSPRSPISVNRILGNARSIFKYASDDNRFIDRPLPYLKALERESKEIVKKHRAKQLDRLLTSDEIKQVIDHAAPDYRVMILLGINAGYNNSDLRELAMENIEGYETGVMDYARAKTGGQRITPLWTETVEALRKWLLVRPEANPTKYSFRWSEDRHTARPSLKPIAG